jgi:hypothetical protein
MRATYGLSAEQLSQLEGHTVAIVPLENAVAWAYPAMQWDPEPVIQGYSAYTASLDQLDASFLHSSAAPSRILAQPPFAIDGRYPVFDPPTTWVTLLCRYTQLSTSTYWQVLGRVPDRCGPLEPVAHEYAVFGQRVTVPAAPAGSAIVARFLDVPLPLSYKVSALVLKPPVASIDTSSGSFRFIMDTAGDLHLMQPSTTTGYSAPFQPPSLSWFSLNGAGIAPGQGSYRIQFYRIRVAPS